MQTTALKHVAYLADLCAKHEVLDIVLSPGSRNAPIIIAFEAHPQINTYLIHDERVAAFFALGLAESKKRPVAIACTSGSAPLNYAPAISEAYYRSIPLLVLTADRPAHLIDQGDGQTIRQYNVFANYIKQSFQFPEIKIGDSIDLAKIEAKKVLEALINKPLGPIHLNLPFDEPLYKMEDFLPEELIKLELNQDTELTTVEKDQIKEIWEKSEKKMILVGQHQPDKELEDLLGLLANDPSVAVLVENTSNVKNFAHIVHCIDRTLATITEEEIEKYSPDLLISLGGAIISKRIKAFLRKNKPHSNIKVGRFLIEEDTYQSLTHTIKIDEKLFLNYLLGLENVPTSNFGGKWKQKDFLSREIHDQFISSVSYSDLAVFDFLLDAIPDDAHLHMANSSVVRYCQLFDPVKGTHYFSNRGVSGIDGSSSTAAGHAVAKNNLQVLISGDISFFYDSNAFWNKYVGSNLKVIVISNGGGEIFNIIPGPSSTTSHQTFFAPTTANVEGICNAYDLNFIQANNLDELASKLPAFFTNFSDRPTVLEIRTNNSENAAVLADYFKVLGHS
ncbi:2-succinyl-5-enolpyruvyl-6-hydroxy-3-cyclohexene-1-carboxylic-acid synthase [Paracrocinitomix mangrovi]|uniref:2-succinyl-5-enolpyruvyl-6-hydroxy-3- cyclohexene-1-carboxylic-acid synthase n=1 Tax=Paracrocinitomix mangrovi TaxID=2862509 RepID=UPI001C8E1392|nr:2-succinyl-5-enolpyruvyl-6-hydroxy-3-cyclohexene-1-carboxylic-acid synthase [Paracrocinitomix mangrovi]UKN03058.1 2-succinyl-5-enolpyruvyl-6-hydroxy-3-cyclohexene-1-carboxylic-acid synthase [Paracrocinitomix mangrovi]